MSKRYFVFVEEHRGPDNDTRVISSPLWGTWIAQIGDRTVYGLDELLLLYSLPEAVKQRIEQLEIGQAVDVAPVALKTIQQVLRISSEQATKWLEYEVLESNAQYSIDFKTKLQEHDPDNAHLYRDYIKDATVALKELREEKEVFRCQLAKYIV